MTSLRVLRLTGAALVAVSAALAFTTSGASAHKGGPVPPDAGDDRAVAFDGNATTCADIGLTGAAFLDGKTKLEADGFASRNNDQTKVTIGSVPEGMTLIAIVVKGADGYNIYKPGERGLGSSLPYTDLRSPTNGGGNIPNISHWFACATQVTGTGGNGGNGGGQPGTGGNGGNGGNGGGQPGTGGNGGNGGGQPGTGGNGGDGGAGGGQPGTGGNGGNGGAGGGQSGTGGNGGGQVAGGGAQVGTDGGEQPGTADTGGVQVGTDGGGQPGTDGNGAGGTTAGTQQGAVDSATAPASVSNAKQLANTGFDPTTPTILAVLLLLVGGLMVITPAKILALAGRLRRH